MSNVEESLKQAMEIDGALGVALVDHNSGMTLGTAGGATIDLEIAAAGNTEVIRAKQKVMAQLGLNEKIEDILITLNSQHHLIRLLTEGSGGEGLFLYLALNSKQANLAMARRQLQNIENSIVV